MKIAVQNLKLLPELCRLKIGGHGRHDYAEEGAGVEDECVVDAIRGEPAARVGCNRQDGMKVNNVVHGKDVAALGADVMQRSGGFVHFERQLLVRQGQRGLKGLDISRACPEI
jgi:hypothetical protein